MLAMKVVWGVSKGVIWARNPSEPTIWLSDFSTNVLCSPVFKWRITKLIQRAFAFWRWGSTVVFFRTWPLSYTRAKLRISTSFSEAMVLCEKMVDYSLRVAAPSEEVKYFRILILSDDWDGPVDECNCSSLPSILITVTGGHSHFSITY